MARNPKHKTLINSRLLKEYASWVYCANCNSTVAYLCYVTYDLFDFEYTCNCGSTGKVCVNFEHEEAKESPEPLKVIKNRLCCPKDDSPLFSLVEKNIKDYKFNVVCNSCSQQYRGKNI